MKISNEKQREEAIIRIKILEEFGFARSCSCLPRFEKGELSVCLPFATVPVKVVDRHPMYEKAINHFCSCYAANNNCEMPLVYLVTEIGSGLNILYVTDDDAKFAEERPKHITHHYFEIPAYHFYTLKRCESDQTLEDLGEFGRFTFEIGLAEMIYRIF
jgi:hypothetical protein